MITKFKRFMNDNSGMEALQVAGVVILTVAIVVVLIDVIGKAVEGKIMDASTEIEKIR